MAEQTNRYKDRWCLYSVFESFVVFLPGAVPLLIKLLSSSAKHVAGQALWGLGNVIGKLDLNNQH